MRVFACCFVAALMLAVGGMPAAANDSMAEVAIGGLVLKDSDQISLDREELYLSQDEVRVDYLFTNTGSADIEALVAFPLPDQNFGDDSANLPDFRSELDFRTTVEGEAVDYDITVQAMVNGADVTADLAELGFGPSYTPDTWPDYDAALKALTPEQIDSAVSRGLIENVNSPEDPYFQPRWTTRTTVTRKQIFPAGQTLAVSHRYKPAVGGSVGGALNPEYRNEEWGSQRAAQYCIEDGWYRAFDKALAQRATAANSAPYNEVWLGYVLSTGANWKGPIKDFRLVIDKGKPENLISFCADGVKKISPTQFEVRKTDFEPSEDLSILIVEWFTPQE
jgi:hypothetical protein